MARPLIRAVLLRLGGLLARRAALLVGLLALVFAAMELLPGDSAQSTVERGASAAELAERRAALGLDQSLSVRFLRWMSGLPRADLGVSARGEQVTELLGRHFPNTLLLGAAALILTVGVSVLLGCWGALRPRGVVDRVVGSTATMVLALPEFVVASALVAVFALGMGLLPAVTQTSSLGAPASAEMLVLPVLALAIPQIGWNTRVVRAALADEARAPHVAAAILDGLSPRRILARHMLPGALPTVATAAATSTGMLLGGAVVVETIFNYPGVGAMLAGAVRDRDTPVVAGVVALTGVAITVVLVLSDAVRAWATGARI